MKSTLKNGLTGLALIASIGCAGQPSTSHNGAPLQQASMPAEMATGKPVPQATPKPKMMMVYSQGRISLDDFRDSFNPETTRVRIDGIYFCYNKANDYPVRSTLNGDYIQNSTICVPNAIVKPE